MIASVGTRESLDYSGFIIPRDKTLEELYNTRRSRVKSIRDYTFSVGGKYVPV